LKADPTTTSKNKTVEDENRPFNNLH